MAHTPGPWVIWTCLSDEESREILPYAIWHESDTGTQKVAEFFTQDLPSMADATVMAAAPDLLAACKEILNRLDTLPFTADHGYTSIPDAVWADFLYRQVDNLRAAVAKATPS